MNWRNCSGEEIIKNGFIQGHQRYKCKGCGFNFTKGYRGKPLELRQQALKLYLEGMGFRAIGRVLEVSNVTVLKWVRAYGQQAEKVPGRQPAKKVKTAELDELHTYIGRKKLLLALVCRRPGKKAVHRSGGRLTRRRNRETAVVLPKQAPLEKYKN